MSDPTYSETQAQSLALLNKAVGELTDNLGETPAVNVHALQAALSPQQFGHVMKSLAIADFACSLRVSGYELAARELSVQSAATFGA